MEHLKGLQLLKEKLPGSCFLIVALGKNFQGTVLEIR